MFEVTLTIPDLEASDTREAAMLFLESLVMADWSETGLTFRVRPEPGLTETVVLTAAEVDAVLSGKAVL